MTGGRVHAAGHGWTVDTAAEHLRRYHGAADDAFRADMVAVMVDTDCGVWHATWTVRRAMIADGRIPTGSCSLCGGRTDAGVDAHSLCVARERAGAPIVPLDVIDAEICYCAPCARARGDR